MKILLVEDEQKIADFVCTGLAERGFSVRHCNNGETGLEQARDGSFDAIVLDIMLPGRDGLTVLKALREGGDSTPVILLTARNELGDRIKGLDLGADDYVAKPFFVEELAARINALVRRAAGDRVSTLHVGHLVLDRMTREVACRNQRVELTSREYALLEYFMRNPARVLTRPLIAQHVWGIDFDSEGNIIDVYVGYLRRKIDRGAEPQLLHTVRGAGYMLGDD